MAYSKRDKFRERIVLDIILNLKLLLVAYSIIPIKYIYSKALGSRAYSIFPVYVRYIQISDQFISYILD